MNSRAVEPVPMPITPSGGSSASAACAAWRLKSSVMWVLPGPEAGKMTSVAEVVDRKRDGAQHVLLGDAGLDPDLVVVGRDRDRLDHGGEFERHLAGRLGQAQ